MERRVIIGLISMNIIVIIKLITKRYHYHSLDDSKSIIIKGLIIGRRNISYDLLPRDYYGHKVYFLVSSSAFHLVLS